jgi:hypothetical protein
MFQGIDQKVLAKGTLLYVWWITSKDRFCDCIFEDAQQHPRRCGATNVQKWIGAIRGIELTLNLANFWCDCVLGHIAASIISAIAARRRRYWE